MTFARRSLAMAGYAAAAVLSFAVVPASWKEFSDSAQAQQLAGNGIWEFFHAFNTNEIDYDRFYATLPIDRPTGNCARNSLTPARCSSPTARRCRSSGTSPAPGRRSG